MAIAGHQIGKVLCDALGLEGRKVKRLTLDVRAHHVVMVRVTEYVEADAIERMAEVTKRYRLEEVKQ